MDEKLFWSVGSELQIHFVWIRADSQNRPCPLYMELVLFSLKNNNNSSYCMGWLIIVTMFQLLCLLLAQVLCQLLLLFSHQVVPDSLQPRDCGTPGFPVLHYLPQFAQTHVRWVSDTIQPYHPLSLLFSSCPQSFPASGSFPMSVLFASGGQSTGASASASVPSNEYSGLISFRMDWFDLLAVQGTLKNLLQFKELILWNCGAGEDCAYGLTDFSFKCL